MAQVEEPRFGSLADRIAALNQQKNFSVPSSGRRAPPPPPPGRPAPDLTPAGPNSVKEKQTPARLASPPPEGIAPQPPHRTTTPSEGVPEVPSTAPARRAPPPLPVRRDSTQPAQLSPTLPPRRPSAQTLRFRRDSGSSDVSHASTSSSRPSLNREFSQASIPPAEIHSPRRLPPTLDQAKLPALPPTKRERDAQAAQVAAGRQATEAGKTALTATKSAPVVPQIAPATRPSLPPRLPSRPAKSPPREHVEKSAPTLPARRLPPVPASSSVCPVSPDGPARSTGASADDAPPPVPASSRPTLAQIDAVAARASANNATHCLVCRDFSGPDSVAAQYPTHTLPRHDPVGYLANVLCGPFPSATDKARAVFTWCHHNIAYNVEEFFGKCIRGRNVEETIFHGKAVCQGYAEVYQAIARRAGLHCVVVSGHGKGFGFAPLAEGQPVPPRNPTGHAWNAVCIDNGEWKLIDACWGAGSVSTNKYEKHFTPEMFYLSNDLFGLKHFPSDARHFYRSDGRVLSWEEYMVGPTNGEKAKWYGAATAEGISEFTFAPAQKHIPVNSGQMVRFQFGKICEHWIPERHGRGKSYLLMMKIRGVDGRKDELVPLDFDGFWWWADIAAKNLGAPGQDIFLYGLKTLNNKDARGVTKQEYHRVIGSGGYSMSWDCYVCWQLV